MPAACPRKWQVEAARDGRLLGKDLESALRHRETCAECALEERELGALGQELARLPEAGRDQVSIQRSRQRLMAALNESVIDPPRRRFTASRAGALTLGLALAAAAAAWLLVLHRQHPESPKEASREIVEVRAPRGARWSRHQEQSRIFVDFEDGEASFEIHPHPGLSVIVRLPDGEVEDMGTVFDVRVAEQHTRHVAVSEGRVSVRLNGHPTVSLGVGEAWDSEPAAASSAAALASSAAPVAAPVAAPPAVAAKPSISALSRQPLTQVRAPADQAGHAAPPASVQDSQPAPSAQSTKAEDDAYLHIVDLLRAAKDSEARSQAKDYLLRFPNGFRRIEVLNIATRGARDAGAGGALQ